MKKKVLSVLLAAVMAFTVAGCGADTQTPAASSEATSDVQDVTLNIWCPQNQIDTGTMESMVASFQAEHPEWNIAYKIDAVGEDVCKDSVLQDVDAAADVFFFANDQLADLVNAGAIAKLGGAAADLVNNEIAPSVAQTAMYNGDLYAIPFTHNTFFMFYDKTLLNEEDIKTIEGIVAKETADDVYNFYLEASGGWKTGAWYYGAGNTIYGEDQCSFDLGADWNNETGLAVTNYLIDLVNNKKVAFDGEISVNELIADHRLGAWFDGSWNYNSYKDILGDDLGLAIIPTFNVNGEAKQLKGFYGSKAVGVKAGAAFPQVAVAFATYINSAEMQLKRFTETAQIPTNMNAANDEAVLADEVASVIMKEAAEASVAQPVYAEFSSRYWSNAGAILTEIRSGELNKDNAQEKLDTFVANMVVE